MDYSAFTSKLKRNKSRAVSSAKKTFNQTPKIAKKKKIVTVPKRMSANKKNRIDLLKSKIVYLKS